jgi:hypothetical protein
MGYKIGERVIFMSQPKKEYGWKLKDFEEYIICNRAFDEIEYYTVRNISGSEETSWFEEDDFLTLKEYRKLKLKKLKNGN